MRGKKAKRLRKAAQLAADKYRGVKEYIYKQFKRFV